MTYQMDGQVLHYTAAQNVDLLWILGYTNNANAVLIVFSDHQVLLCLAG